jgi:alpha-1,4-digalacturonate transport system permease protein
MSGIGAFLLRRRGGRGWHWSDVAAWAWLGFGLVAILGPLLWLGLSSLKSPAALAALALSCSSSFSS